MYSIYKSSREAVKVQVIKALTQLMGERETREIGENREGSRGFFAIFADFACFAFPLAHFDVTSDLMSFLRVKTISFTFGSSGMEIRSISPVLLIKKVTLLPSRFPSLI